MQAQNFKGDANELKMRASAEPAFDLTNVALDDFYQNGDVCSPFLLMLYDEDRIPFSQRIDRDVFVSFFKKAFENFPFIGNFESYIFILQEVFGADTQVLFDVPAPGKLSISVNAQTDSVYDFLVIEIIDGEVVLSTLGTLDGLDNLVLRGLSGIETEEELALLFAELIPAGIFPEISLDFFTISTFIGEDDSGVFDVIDSDENTLIFVETGD